MTDSQIKQGTIFDWDIWLQRQRHKIINILLKFILLIGVIAVVYQAYIISIRPDLGQIINFVVYAVAFTLILLIFVIKQTSDQLRIILFIISIYLVSIYSLWAGWLHSSGRVYLLVLITVSTLLINTRAGYIVASANCFIYAFFGLAFYMKWLTPIVEVSPITLEGFMIFIHGVAFFMATAILLITQRYLHNAFNKATEISAQAYHSEQQATLRTRELQLTANVSRQITTVLNLHDLLPQLVTVTKEAFDLYLVAIFLHDLAEERLVLAASSQQNGEMLQQENLFFDLNTAPNLITQAALEHTHIIVNDVNQETFSPHIPEIQSELALPMLVGEKLIGVLSLHAKTKNRFPPSEVDVFVMLAEQIGVAVDNAQLYEVQTRLAQELRETDQLKNQFLASMSHELRTPLNAIINFTQMLSLGMMGPVNEEQADLLNQSLDSANHLLNLINDILDISKIQAGKLVLYVEDDVDLYAVLTAVVNMVEPLLQNKPVTFVQDIDDHLPRIRGDKRRIRQILLNLLSNAAKFTNEGNITLGAKNQGDHVLFAIMDSGPGIAHDMQEIIFHPFIQTEQGLKHTEGTGLGLPITKSLVEAHGGQLWLESKLGEGVTFFVTLPIPH